MRLQTVKCGGMEFKLKGEITPDTELWVFCDRNNQTFFIVGTSVGIRQFKASPYYSDDRSSFTQLLWTDPMITEAFKLLAAKVTDWPRIRRVGREWNFVF